MQYHDFQAIAIFERC